MSLLDYDELGLDESQEPTLAKAGEEKKLRIVSVDSGVDKNDMDYYLPRLEIADDPYSKEFTYFMYRPDKNDMSEKQLNRARWNMKSFCQCFNIDVSRPSDPEDSWPGHEGWAVLGVSKSDEFGEQNYIKKLLAPK